MIPLKKNRLNRRTFLRAAGSTAIALPALEAMFPSDRAYAQNAAGKPRFLAIYQPNGHDASQFAPTGARGALSFGGRSTEAIAPHAAQVTFLSGMVGSHGVMGTPGASSGNDHLVAICSFLTGKPVPRDAETTHSISADKFIADYYEANFPTGKSQYAAISGSGFVDPPNPGVGYNNDMKAWLASDKNGQRIVPAISLIQIADQMFAGANPQTSAEQREKERLFNKSVLDAVLEDTQRVKDRTGVADQRVMESYLENIRGLEQRLGQPGGAALACNAMNVMERRQWPTDFRNDFKQEYIDEHWLDTTRLLAVAFQCEAIRSVSYMLETEAGESGHKNRNLGDSHGSSHSGSEAYAARDKLYSEVFKDMLDVFKATPVSADSSVLDNTAIIWGAGIGVNHSHDQQMSVLAGFNANGAINHGASRIYNNDPVTSSAAPLMRTLMMHMGVMKDTDVFGDTGPGKNFPNLIDLGA